MSSNYHKNSDNSTSYQYTIKYLEISYIVWLVVDLIKYLSDVLFYAKIKSSISWCI